MDRIVLYRSQAEHAADCEAFPYERIPYRVFLDTNVIDCLVKWSKQIFEHVAVPYDAPPSLAEDIMCLRHVFYVGSRAYWDIVASPKTVEELSNTHDDDMRNELMEYGIGLVGQGAGSGSEDEDGRHAASLGRRLRESSMLRALPHANDRELIGHAVGFGCDVFCTRDRKSIYNKRHHVAHILPLRIMTPQDWWRHIRPWAGLWM
jgi:hypothetical protein